MRGIYSLALIGAISLGAVFGGIVGYHARPIVQNVNFNFYKGIEFGEENDQEVEEEKPVNDDIKDRNYGSPLFDFLVDDFEFSQKRGITNLEGRCNGSNCKVTFEKETNSRGEQMRIKVYKKSSSDLANMPQ